VGARRTSGRVTPGPVAVGAEKPIRAGERTDRRIRPDLLVKAGRALLRPR
jgi:hypothetical protein